MGTDYPYPWTKTTVDLVLDTPGVADAPEVAMLGLTAMKLLGLASWTAVYQMRAWVGGIVALGAMIVGVVGGSTWVE